MTYEPELIPLSESEATSEDVRELLRVARDAGGPSEAQLARLGARVAPAVGLPMAALSGASPAVGVAPASATASTGGASLAPAAATQLGGSAGVKAVLAKLGSASLLKGLGLAGALGLGALGYGVMQGGEPEPAVPVEAPVRVADVPPGPAPAPAAPRVVVTPLAPETAEDEAQAEARPEPARPQRQKAQARSAPSAQDVPSELRLMQRAQGQRDQPAAMLRTLGQHARFYPEGMLAQERDVLRIEALVKLGRVEQARKQAARMERAHPGSPHLVRVRALLADAP